MQPSSSHTDVANSADTGKLIPSTAAASTPRYTLLIVDALPACAAAADKPCAVLLLPRGRAHEYAFSTAAGLRSIAQTAATARLIAVRLNAGHEFSDHHAGEGILLRLHSHTCPHWLW